MQTNKASVKLLFFIENGLPKKWLTTLGIAAGGEFYNVQPGAAAWLCFVDEVKNFCSALFVTLELLLIVICSGLLQCQAPLAAILLLCVRFLIF